ncbi:glycosyltransferase family 2 protein [Rhizobium sp. FKL33]|uniref:glycosyltransferase family 2 protein n=1 Tax=Rhizobium sp. FKL33 TaxID=2562307 RepID=UPI0010BFB73F|nr:glycosyltransferase family 2 protein [Rhizobium sp. FKL33]
MFGQWISAFKKSRRLAAAEKDINRRFDDSAWRSAPLHDLPGQLIVSLTSYPKRYSTLALTLKGLLAQSQRPDRILLWLDVDDITQLPSDVRRLENDGVEIQTCPDWRSYKKIIPALQAYPDAFILTADDDVYYQRDTIAALTAAYDPEHPHILALRAHKVALDQSGQPLAYGEWPKNTQSEAPSPLTFPTGALGVLYPPGVFDPEVVNDAQFMSLSPSADDVWLYWMWRRKGYLACKVGGKRRFLDWPESQATSLREANLAGGNDRAIANLIEAYGFPPVKE